MQSKKIGLLLGLLMVGLGAVTLNLYAAQLNVIRKINTLMRHPAQNEAEIRRLINSSNLKDKSAWIEKLVHLLERDKARTITKARATAKPVKAGGAPVVAAVYGDTAVIVVDVQYDFMKLAHINEMGAVAEGKLSVFGTGVDYRDAVEKFVDAMRAAGILIVFTKDWHPAGHMSFADSWLDKEGKVMGPWGAAGNNRIQEDFKVNPNPPSGMYCHDTLEAALENRLLDEAGQPLNTQQFLIGKKLWPSHCIQDTVGADVAMRMDQERDLVVHKGMSCYADSNSGFKDDSGKETELNGILKGRGIKKIILLGIALDVCVALTEEHGLEFGYKEDFIVNLSRGVNLAPNGGDLRPKDSIETLEKAYKNGVRLVWINGLGEQLTLNVEDMKRDGKIEVFANVQAYIKDLKNVGVQKQSRAAEQEVKRQVEEKELAVRGAGQQQRGKQPRKSGQQQQRQQGGGEKMPQRPVRPKEVLSEEIIARRLPVANGLLRDYLSYFENTPIVGKHLRFNLEDVFQSLEIHYGSRDVDFNDRDFVKGLRVLAQKGTFADARNSFGSDQEHWDADKQVFTREELMSDRHQKQLKRLVSRPELSFLDQAPGAGGEEEEKKHAAAASASGSEQGAGGGS